MSSPLALLFFSISPVLTWKSVPLYLSQTLNLSCTVDQFLRSSLSSCAVSSLLTLFSIQITDFLYVQSRCCRLPLGQVQPTHFWNCCCSDLELYLDTEREESTSTSSSCIRFHCCRESHAAAAKQAKARGSTLSVSLYINLWQRMRWSMQEIGEMIQETNRDIKWRKIMQSNKWIYNF